MLLDSSYFQLLNFLRCQDLGILTIVKCLLNIVFDVAPLVKHDPMDHVLFVIRNIFHFCVLEMHLAIVLVSYVEILHCFQFGL